METHGSAVWQGGIKDGKGPVLSRRKQEDYGALVAANASIGSTTDAGT